ncbi:alpha/beta hydrolase [Luteimonas aestuarii]|uniref:Alpha/beta hydrolase n=1 Tax=Luteimonas aestuarii TaxID=453837 RepID=A0A4V3ALG5_9GAMM|nr:alpha/beta hydrolase [Luteimonas aestuarii]TDK22749.1 alpha/beta hydrolase [Luteimonas aestuarii]
MSWLVLLCAIALLVALAFALVVLAIWRDPARLIRAEYARQRIACGFVRRQVAVDGLRWCYAERDSDHAGTPTLVMLHGYTGSKENWYRLCTALPRRYRLLAPDLPGWGESERVADADHGFAAQAVRVAGFLRHVARGPVVLLGHSMGGGIATLVAARHPDLVDKLVLLDAAGVEFAENAFGRAVLEGGNPFGVADSAALDQYFSILFHERHARPRLPWPGSWAYMAHRRREAAFEQSVLDRIGRSDERFLPGQEATRIRQPTLLLWGAHDAVIDPSAMALYAERIPHAHTGLLERSGHMTLMEEPRAVAEAVVALIEEESA